MFILLQYLIQEPEVYQIQYEVNYIITSKWIKIISKRCFILL